MTDAAFKSGPELAHWFDDIDDEQIQPNGIDLTADKLYKQEAGYIVKDNKDVGERVERNPTDGKWVLQGPCIVQYGEEICIPDDCIGFVFPRSTLMRNACELHTAVWDSGYRGIGEGLLIPHTETIIKRGERIAQIVMATCDPEHLYDGDYQEEKLEDN